MIFLCSFFIACLCFHLLPSAAFFALGSMGFPLEAMTSPPREAGLLTSPLVWWTGNWFKNNWTSLHVCLSRTIKHKNTDTTSGYRSTCALDFLQTWKMYQGNTITHTQPCYILSPSIHLLLTVVRGSTQGRWPFCSDRKWPHLYSYIFSPNTIHAKITKVQPALNHRTPVSRLALKNELTFFCQVHGMDHCQKGTLSEVGHCLFFCSISLPVIYSRGKWDGQHTAPAA